MRGRWRLVGTCGALAILAAACGPPRRPPPPLFPTVSPALTPMPPERTVASVVAEVGADVRGRLAPHFHAAGLAYPPAELALLAFKRERRLETWARGTDAWVRIDAVPILAASGGPGPKLRQGDRQVPEGIYRVAALNPNSFFHLSIMLDYPNAFDQAAARQDGRTNLGGDIFIHGRDVSSGCLAVGDHAIETLFVLVADVGPERVRVVVAPHDPRDGLPLTPEPAVWFTQELYPLIDRHLEPFRAAGGRS